MPIDLEQFHQVFFEESLEGLDVMEQTLLTVSTQGADDESINTIFRAAHSIKGGSGTFGFIEITDFTHAMETLLDEVREGERKLCENLIELLLKSSDCLRQMINDLQQQKVSENALMPELLQSFNSLLAGDDSNASKAAELSPAVAVDENDENEPATEKRWHIEFIPDPQILTTGNEPLRIFRELELCGDVTVSSNTSRLPDFYHLNPDECYTSWEIDITTCADKEELAEIFDWVINECKLTISENNQKLDDEGKGADSVDKISSPSAPHNPSKKPSADQAPTITAVGSPSTDSNKADENTAPTSTSIRVGIDKVDSLINLVGELVITQSMLSELGNDFDMSKVERLSNGLEQLLQNTKELQESVMRIRMLPISFAFNRFPRMIRDLSAKTGKKVELIIQGEQTELDKTVMEQIGDPMVHLVRNAIDHGIEPAEQRLQCGKTEQGCISLDAYHQGGSIIIEVRDDGRGIDREIIIGKAIEKNLVSPDNSRDMSDEQVFDLIFEPGFSTADTVSDISGRGVGMDVVKRNIKSLGGRINIESEVGKGSVFRIQLPLTLAILDGQLIRIEQEIYVVPLISIVESLQIKSKLVKRVAGNKVLYQLRDDNVPIVALHELFNIDTTTDTGTKDIENALLVVVEVEGEKIGLLVDELLAQQQVVIKSLQDNYQQIPGISGATILGDGSVAMILDTAGLFEFAVSQSGRAA